MHPAFVAMDNLVAMSKGMSSRTAKGPVKPGTFGGAASDSNVVTPMTKIKG